MKEIALDEANRILHEGFNEEPGFRIKFPGPVTSEFVVQKEFTWLSVQGDNDEGVDVLMTSSSDTACFLTQVTGQFEGGGEFFEMADSGGFWGFDGNSEREDFDAGIHY